MSCVGYVCWCLLLLSILSTVYPDNVPTITTDLGVITGEEKTSKFMEHVYTIHRYLGIPYAKAPLGNLRFKRPHPYGQFSEPFEATKYGPACPQLDIMKIGFNSTSEDCLYLNIVVPEKAGSSGPGRAVMVFIHGGGFMIGSGDMLEGDVLAPFGDVIVVTINYRLGIFGFLNTGNDDHQGNMGLWDQRLALQWVHDNVDAFGGDNSRITIMGESAGAMSVLYQAMYPPNEGLFHNVIAQSGTPTLMGLQQNNVHCITDLAELLGCSLASVAESLKCITSTDAASIMVAIRESFKTKPPVGIQFLPTVDGEMIAEDPILVVRESTQGRPSPAVDFLRSLAVINGMDGAEGAMWLDEALFGQDTEDLVLTREDLKEKHIRSLLPLVLGFGRKIPEEIVNMIASEYTFWNEEDLNNARKLFVKFASDIYFNVPGYEFSLLHANYSDARSWMYSFEPRTEAELGKIPSWVEKASHGDELAAVFGYRVSPVVAAAFNVSEDYVPPDWEMQLSRRIMTYWTTFAKTGNPNEKSGEESWPSFNLNSHEAIMFDRDEDRIGSFMYAREHQFWRKTIPEVMDAILYSSGPSKYSENQETCEADGSCG